MKPVIKKQTFYSMLLMRDDSEVRAFRVRNTTLRFVVGLFIAFIFFGAAGIGVGAHYWKRYATIIDEYRQNERELSEARLQLQQLGGMEKIAMASSCPIPLIKNDEVGAEGPARQQNATLPVAISGLSAPNGAGASNATQSLLNATAMSPSGSVPGFREPVQEKAETSPAGETQSSVMLPLISSDESPLRINNYSGRPINQQRLRVRYDLSTAVEVQEQVAGNAKYTAIFTNGTRLDMEPERNGDSAFSIRSMKPMNDTLRLPPGFTTRHIKNIDITLDLEDGRKYQETYSFTR